MESMHDKELRELRERNSTLEFLLKEQERESDVLLKECGQLLKVNKFARASIKRERFRYIALLRQVMENDGRHQQCQLAYDTAMQQYREYMRRHEAAKTKKDLELATHFWTCAMQSKRRADLALEL